MKCKAIAMLLITTFLVSIAFFPMPVRAETGYLWAITETALYPTLYKITTDGAHVQTFHLTMPIYGPMAGLEFQPAVNRPPVAEANGPYTGSEGSPITFDASGSSDPDGDTLQYRWDFDNDGTWDTEWSSSPSASYTWFDDFIGSAKVEVSDGELTDTDTADVTVSNVAPSVEAGPDQTVYLGDTVSFSGSFTDPGTLDTHTILWNFGDGSSAGTLTPTHVYLSCGTFIVTLTVTDDDGGAGSDTLMVTVRIPIDIKPGISPNSINLNDQGLLPVAILGSSGFDVTTINPETILLGGVDVATRGSAKAPKLAYSYEDVNSDGIMDMVAFFKVQDLVAAGALTPTTTELTLTGALYDGTPVQGTDTVRIVPP